MSNRKKNNKLVWIIIISCIAILIPLISVGVLFAVVIFDESYVKFDSDKIAVAPSVGSVKFYDINNEELPCNIDQITDFVTYDNLKQHTIDCFVTVEDKRFFQHNGIDIKRILGAAKNNIKDGSYKEGASTITQQLAKNVYLTNDKNFKRKINEMLLAFKIEDKFNKKQIFEAYVNTIYFGGNLYGINKAAEYYFGTSASSLSLSQSAGLAGLIKAPNNYSPIDNPEQYRLRRDLVLKMLLDENKISAFQYNQATTEKYVEIIHSETAQSKRSHDYYVIEALNQASQILGISKTSLLKKKCKIYTYCDIDAQKKLVRSFDEDITNTLSGRRANKCGIVLDNFNRGISAFFSNGTSQTSRTISPGSTIKPLAVYAPALEMNKISPLTPVLDKQMSFGDGFQPSNYMDKYLGWTSVRKAVEQSLNVPAVKTANIIGTSNCVKYLNLNGFDIETTKSNLTIALGNISGGCSAKQLLDGYATLAQNGTYSSSSMIKKIEIDEKIVYSHTKSAKKVFSDSTAFLMTDMLQDVTTKGTAKDLNVNSYQIAGKTGTSGLKKGANSDAMFCGYTTKHTFLFWLGANSNTDLLDKSTTGGKQPVKIAKSFLEKLYTKENAPSDFEMPNTVQAIKIDKVLLEKEQKIAIASAKMPKTEIIEDIFSKSYLPGDISNRTSKHEKLTLELKFSEGKVVVETNNKQSKIYKIDKKGVPRLIKIGNVAEDSCPNENSINTYFAELPDGQSIYKEIYVKIKKENENGEEKNEGQNIKQKNEKRQQDLFDNWFWKW